MIWGFTELRCPYENWDIPECRELFHEMVSIKKSGYTHNYEKLLPVGTGDFISDHYLVWKMVDGKKVYISGMRTTTMDITNKYNLTYPCEELLSSIGKVSDVRDYLQCYQALIKPFNNNSLSVRYFSGWTIRPEFRSKDPSGRLLQFAAVSTMVLSHREYNSKIALVAGMPHVKTDKIFFDMGYKTWTKNGEVLPALPSPNFNMHPALFMSCTEHSNSYLEKVSFIQKQWDNRIIVGNHYHTRKKDIA